MGRACLDRFARRHLHDSGDRCPTVLVYDYFGSWTEAPVESQVPFDDAANAMEQFALSGKPATEKVAFQPD
jgi:hypothetical protein